MRTKTRGSKARLSKLPPASTSTRPLPFLNLNGEFNNDVVAPDSIDKTDICDMGMGLLEGETCIRCDRGGQVLVCCQTGCPIAIHEKCMHSEPKFDDMGRFYCPYCWYKRLVKRTKEFRKRAMLAKKALSNFIDSKMVGGDGKEVNMSQCEIDRNWSDCENRRVEEDQENDGDNASEHRTDPLPSVVNGVDNVHHGQEETAPGIESLQGSRSEEKLDEENVSESLEYVVVEDGGRIQVVDSRQVDDSQHEGVIEDHECEVLEDGERIQAEPLNACCMEGEEIEDGSHHASTKGICDTAMVSEEKQERTEEEEQKHSKAPETTMLSTGGDTAPEVPAEDAAGSESSDLDTEALSVRQRRIKKRSGKKARIQNVDSPKKSPFQRKKARIQNVDSPKKSPFQRKKARHQIVDSPQKSSSQPDATAEGNTRNQNKKVTMSKKSRQPQESAKRFTNLIVANEKRKRLHWTAEEEEMLKEGVQKFSSTVNKNLPWRKILEFGRHVFDVSRTPIDLKDKWRNIMAKESSAMNR